MEIPVKAIHIPVDEPPSMLLVNGLEHYQALVGDGLIESVANQIGTTIYCNEDGIDLGLEPNLVATMVAGQHLVGDVVIVGLPDEDGDDTDVSTDVVLLVMQAAKEVGLVHP